MVKGKALQEAFLDALREQQVPVAIYLVSGIKLQGKIAAFDQFVLLLNNSTNQVVYKHAISTIVPMRHIHFPGFEQNPEKDEN